MESSNPDVLKMRGICKSFGPVQVLKNVNFTLKKGEIHALAGENGAGKSTLIKGLIGVHAFDQGEIILDGKKVSFSNAHEARNYGISVVFQELSQIETLTVAENIFLITDNNKSKLSKFSRRELFKKASNLLEQYNIDINPRELVSNLIIAKRQLLEIVKAVSVNPKILVLDEPTSSLTDAETKILFNMLDDLKAKGTSIIYITHRMNEIFEKADRITILRDGTNVCDSDIKDISFDDVVRHMVGRDVSIFDGKHNNQQRSKKIVLEVNHLSKNNEFDDVSFQLHEGEVLGFAGLVGSGRTELMQLLFGIRKSNSGEVLINGKDYRNKSTAEIINAGMAMVPESRRLQGLFLMHSVESNISITTLPDLSKATIVQKSKVSSLANRMIQKLNIDASSPKENTWLLSGGNQQKVVLAKWLAVNPKILILDEPTTGIDVQSKSEIYKLISELTKTGTSIILISSEMQELLNNSDRIIVLNDKHIVGEVGNDSTQEEIMELILKDKVKYGSLKEVG